jgi:hypothetical protein
VRCIARGQGGVLRYHDACDHGIAQITGTTLLVTERHKIARLLSGLNIEWNNPVVDLVEKFLERLDQSGSPLAAWHSLESESDFKNCNGSCPNGCARLAVEPCNDILVGCYVHQSRKHAGVEDSHGLRLAIWRSGLE